MKQVEKFTANLKKRRTELNLTQSEAAAAIGMTQQMYQRIESGKNPDIRISTLSRIAKAFQCTMLDLFT